VHEIKFDGYPSPVGRARMPLVLKLLIEDPPIELTARFIRW
jgi:hypothetical protein